MHQPSAIGLQSTKRGPMRLPSLDLADDCIFDRSGVLRRGYLTLDFELQSSVHFSTLVGFVVTAYRRIIGLLKISPVCALVF